MANFSTWHNLECRLVNRLRWVRLIFPVQEVDEVIAEVDRDSLMLLKPGVHVGLDVESVSDPSAVEEWLLEKVEGNGWVYDPDSKFVLVASMGIGESQRVDYQAELTGDITTVNFKPHFAKLKIMQNDLIVWQSGTSTGPPPFVRLKKGRTVQSEVNRYSKPQLNFFKKRYYRIRNYRSVL